MKYGLVRRFICFCADIRTASAAAANISRTDCNSFIFCLFNREQSKSTEEIFLQEERLCECKVNYKRYHIDYSRYHRSRHERGVQFYELCDNRQGAADYLRNYHGADHRRRNDEIDGNSAGGEEEHSADVDRCEGQSADKCDSYLFEYDFKIVLRPYLAERKSADYQRRNLISCLLYTSDAADD